MFGSRGSIYDSCLFWKKIFSVNNNNKRFQSLHQLLYILPTLIICTSREQKSARGHSKKTSTNWKVMFGVISFAKTCGSNDWAIISRRDDYSRNTRRPTPSFILLGLRQHSNSELEGTPHRKWVDHDTSINKIEWDVCWISVEKDDVGGEEGRNRKRASSAGIFGLYKNSRYYRFVHMCLQSGVTWDPNPWLYNLYCVWRLLYEPPPPRLLVNSSYRHRCMSQGFC